MREKKRRKKKKKKKPQGKNIMVCPIPQGDHNNYSNMKTSCTLQQTAAHSAKDSSMIMHYFFLYIIYTWLTIRKSNQLNVFIPHSQKQFVKIHDEWSPFPLVRSLVHCKLTISYQINF